MPKPKRPLRLPEGDDPEGMAALTRDFVDWMRSRNFSESTVANRTAYLRRFATWCADRGITQPREVTRPVLERFQRFLFHYRRPSGQPLSFRSQGVQITAIRTFFRYLARSNRILSNPGSDLELPKAEKRLPRGVLSRGRGRAGPGPGRSQGPLRRAGPGHPRGALLLRPAPQGARRPLRLRPRRRARDAARAPGQGQEGPHGAYRRASPGLGREVPLRGAAVAGGRARCRRPLPRRSTACRSRSRG